MDIKIIATNNFDDFNPLWEKLKDHHIKTSTFFKEEFTHMTFEKRMEQLKEKVKDGTINLLLAFDNERKEHIGACVSSVFHKQGEIDFLYVSDEYRGKNIGEMLMQASLEWINKNNIEKITLNVAVGNEIALSFYERFHFYPRTLTLVQKQ